MSRIPIHPGEIIHDKLLERGLTVNEFAALIDIPIDVLNKLIEGKLAITASIAYKLSQYLGTSCELWLNLQKTCEERQQFLILAGFANKLASDTIPLDEDIAKLLNEKFFEMYEKF